MPGDKGSDPIQLTVEEKICTHLLKFHHRRNEYVLPGSISQSGIAESVGIQRGHASVALISLKNKNLIDEKISRVRESSRRKKVYFLTEQGIDEAMKIRKLLEDGQRSSKVNGADGTLEFLGVVPTHMDDEGGGKGTEVDAKEKDETTVGDELSLHKEMVPEKHEILENPESIVIPLSPADERVTDAKHIRLFQQPSPPPRPRVPPRFSGKQEAIIAGLWLSVFTLALLWYSIDRDNETALVFSYLFLILAMITLNALSFNRSPGSDRMTVTLQDIALLTFSLMLLGITIGSTIDTEIHFEEILQAVIVFIPILVLLRLKEVVPKEFDVRIAGICGTLIILYGLSQTVLSIYPGEMHYPMVWVAGGFLIFVQGYFLSIADRKLDGDLEDEEKRKEEKEGGGGEEDGAEQERGKGEDEKERGKSEEAQDGGKRENETDRSYEPQAPLMAASCVGIGIFILITLLSIGSDLEMDGLMVLLVPLWFILALMLILLGVLRDKEGTVIPILLSSLFILTGCLFLFAAGVFISLEKYVEAVMEVLVGLIILRFSLNYLGINQWNLLYSSMIVLVGMGSVYELYVNI